MAFLDDARAQIPELAKYSDDELVELISSKTGKPRDVIAEEYEVYDPKKKRNVGQVAGDLALEWTNALTGTVSSAADMVVPGNQLSRGIQRRNETREGMQSYQTQRAKRQLAEGMDAEGFVEPVKAVGKYIWENPGLAATQAAGSFVGPGAAIKGAKGIAALGKLGEKGIERAGLGAGMTASGALSGGDAAGNAYELVMNSAQLAHLPEEERHAMAVDAARKASIAPAIYGAATGAFGAEGALARGASKGILKTGLKEAALEGGDEALSAFSGRYSASQYDDTIDPLKGVVGAGAMGAALGGMTGAAVGFATRQRPEIDPNDLNDKGKETSLLGIQQRYDAAAAKPFLPPEAPAAGEIDSEFASRQPPLFTDPFAFGPQGDLFSEVPYGMPPPAPPAAPPPTGGAPVAPGATPATPAALDPRKEMIGVVRQAYEQALTATGVKTTPGVIGRAVSRLTSEANSVSEVAERLDMEIASLMATKKSANIARAETLANVRDNLRGVPEAQRVSPVDTAPPPQAPAPAAAAPQQVAAPAPATVPVAESAPQSPLDSLAHDLIQTVAKSQGANGPRNAEIMIKRLVDDVPRSELAKEYGMREDSIKELEASYKVRMVALAQSRGLTPEQIQGMRKSTESEREHERRVIDGKRRVVTDEAVSEEIAQGVEPGAQPIGGAAMGADALAGNNDALETADVFQTEGMSIRKGSSGELPDAADFETQRIDRVLKKHKGDLTKLTTDQLGTLAAQRMKEHKIQPTPEREAGIKAIVAELMSAERQAKIRAERDAPDLTDAAPNQEENEDGVEEVYGQEGRGDGEQESVPAEETGKQSAPAEGQKPVPAKKGRVLKKKAPAPATATPSREGGVAESEANTEASPKSILEQAGEAWSKGRAADHPQWQELTEEQQKTFAEFGSENWTPEDIALEAKKIKAAEKPVGAKPVGEAPKRVTGVTSIASPNKQDSGARLGRVSQPAAPNLDRIAEPEKSAPQKATDETTAELQRAMRDQSALAWNRMFQGVDSIPMFADLPQELQDRWTELGPKNWNRQQAVGIIQSIDGAAIVERSERQTATGKVTKPTTTQADEVREEIKEFIGGENSNKVEVFQYVEDIPEWVRIEVEKQTGDITSSTQGFVYDGKAYLIAENIPRGKARAVFMHEVGSHLGLQGLLTRGQFEKISDKVKEWAERQDGSLESRLAQKAFSRVYSSTQTAKGTFSNTELVAYFVEEATNEGVTPQAVHSYSELGRWFRQLWAFFKTALRKLKMDGNLNSQDIIDLAYGAARAEMHGTWHGTAADFHKFNHRYRGTGEGRLDVGDDNYTDMVAYGTYLADVRGVADQYREVLSAGQRANFTIDGKPAYEVMKHNPAWRAAEKYVSPEVGSGKTDVVGWTLDKIARYGEKETQEWIHRLLADQASTKNQKTFVTHAMNVLYSLKGKEVAFKQGNLLRTDTAIADDEWLDWDKSFKDQSEKVQNALNGHPGFHDAVNRADVSLWLYDEIDEFVSGAGPRNSEKARQVWLNAVTAFEFDMHKKKFPELLEEAGASPAMMKHYTEVIRPALHKWMADNSNEFRSGQQIYDWVSDVEGSQKRASEALDRLGVKGVRYLDGVSRDMGEGTHNYVVFNPKNITIAAKNLHRGRAYNVERSEAPSARAERVFEALPPPAKSMMKGIWTTLKDLGKKGALTGAITQDIADMAEKNLPSVRKYIDAQQARQATRLEHESAIDKVLSMYDHLKHEERGTGPGSVNAFIFDSTMSGKWGYKLDDISDFQPDPEMARRFNKFSPEGQKLIRAVFAHGHKTLQLKQAAVRAAINADYDEQIQGADDTKKKQLEKDRNVMLSRYANIMAMKGNTPYAPIKRFGNYVTIGMSKAFADAKKSGLTSEMAKLETDPKHYWVSFHETLSEAEAKREEIANRYEAVGGSAVASQREAVEQWVGNDVFVGFSKLRKMLAAEFGTGAKTTEMDSMLRSLYLTALSEASGRKSELHRRGIAGGDRDMMRALATQGRADAHFLSTVKHDSDVMDALEAMRKEVKNGDRQNNMRYFNELLIRHQQSMNQQTHRAEDFIKRATSIWMLSTSPAFYAQQLSQTYVVTQPVLSGKFGYWKSGKAINKAYGDAWKMFNKLDPMDLSKAPADVRDMLETLTKHGKIDVGIDMELGSWATTSSSTNMATAAWNKTDAFLRHAVMRLEAFNRSTAAIAAYRMDKAKLLAEGKTEAEAHAQATRYAEKIVHSTHGSYDGFNTPRLMSTLFPGARVITQFRRYQIIQLSLLARLFHGSFKGATPEERAVARKALGYTLGHGLMFTGALGAPVVSSLATIGIWLFGDEDDPEKKLFPTAGDKESFYRRAIGDQDVADLLLKGTPAALGLDVSQKIGWQNMLSLLPFVDADPFTKKGFEQTVVGLLGPAVSLTGRVAQGIGDMRQGEYYKGMEKLLPNGFANAMKGYRFASEGVTLKNGDVVLPPEEISLVDGLLQGMGLPPEVVARRNFAQGQKLAFEAYYTEQTTQLKARYARAYRDGDSEAMAEAREEWNKLQASRAANGFKRQPLSDLLRAPKVQQYRERNTAGGVEYRQSNRDFVKSLAEQ